MNRRNFLTGVAAAVAAPYVITTPGLLMPVRRIWTPRLWPAPSGHYLMFYGGQAHGELRRIVNYQPDNGTMTIDSTMPPHDGDRYLIALEDGTFASLRLPSPAER